MWCAKRNILGGCCPSGTGCGAKKWSVETHIKTSDIQQNFKLIFESVCNDAFTSIALQRKTWKKCGKMFPPQDTTGMAVVLGGSCPRWQLSGWQLSWVAVVLGGSCSKWQFSRWQLSEYHLRWGQLFPSPCILQPKTFLLPSQKSFEQTTEMTFDLRLANITLLVWQFEVYIAHTLKIWLKKKTAWIHGKHSRLAQSFLLSFDP